MPLTKVTGGEIDGASSINVTGIVTATSFSGDVSGNINSSGVSTFSTLRVGTGVTISSGVVTATSFVGNLTGNVTGNVTGNATGLSGDPSISVNSITAATATFTGNVSVAGTVTYEDVTNIDSIGIVTARGGLRVGTGGTVITTTTDGLVGIGTINPVGQLQVSSGPVIIGAATSTGTASQSLQVTGGAYVSSNLGIANSNPSARVHINAALNGSVGGLFIDSKTRTIADTNVPLLQIDSGIAGGNQVGALWFNSSGNLGIGTINPGYQVIIFGSTPQLAVQHSGTNRSRALIEATDSAVYYGQTYGSNNIPVIFSQGGTTSGAERFRIDTNGNIGIGTTNPSNKLHISGTARIDGNTNPYLVLNDGTNTGYLQIASGNLDLYHNSNVTFSPGSSQKVIINSSGNLGIGTNNPSYKLDLLGTNTDIVRFRGTSSGVRFQSNSTTMDIVSHNGSDNGTRNLLIRQYGASTGILLDTNGNIGIGINTPGSKLEIQSSSNALLALVDTTSYAQGVGGAIYLGGNYRSSNDASSFTRIRSFKENSTNGDYSYGLRFDYTTNNDASNYSRTGITLRGDSGFVGIGTDNPGRLLNLYAATTPIVRLTHTTASSYAGLEVYEGATQKAAFNALGSTSSATGGANAIQVWNFINAPTVFGTNNIERVRITGIGSFGIGVADPEASFHLRGTGGTAGASLWRSGASALFEDNVTNGYFKFVTGTYTNQGSVNLDLITAGNDYGYGLGWRITSGADTSGAGGARSLRINSLTSNGSGVIVSTERVRISDSGNVSIGTTITSGAKLQVTGESSTTATQDSPLYVDVPHSKISMFVGRQVSTSGFSADTYTGTIRFNGSDVAWGDVSYYPNGNGGTGSFRFTRNGSTVSSTPNARIGVGGIWMPGTGIITLNNGDAEIEGQSTYHLRVRTYDGSSSMRQIMKFQGGTSGGHVTIGGDANGPSNGFVPLHFSSSKTSSTTYTHGGSTLFIGQISPGNSGNTYLHVKFDVPFGSMFYLRSWGYVYGYGQVYNSWCAGYLYNNSVISSQTYNSNGSYGITNVYYTGDGNVALRLTLNQGTSNAWGYSAFEGGFDPINGALVDDAIKILAYTWTSSSANQY